MDYHEFVEERHRIWERRQANEPAPWTDEPILAGNKFTNVFRILDPGTQFVVRNLGHANSHTVLFRCFLYRYMNRPEPWQAFRREFGRYPSILDITSTLWPFWRDYSGPLFSPAYRVFPPVGSGLTKLEWVLKLSRELLLSDSLDWYCEPHQGLAARVELLQKLPRCGPFMAMQISTDYGYFDHGQHDENSYIVAGPGAKIGVAAFNGSRDAEAVIREQTQEWRDRGTVTLHGRPPSLMDVQNTFCEYGKYVRAAGRPARSTRYTGHGHQVPPVLPQHWSL